MSEIMVVRAIKIQSKTVNNYCRHALLVTEVMVIKKKSMMYP